MSNHLNKPSEELVLDLINEANNRNFTLTDVNIRDPIAHAQSGKNTRAIAEGIPGSGYVGSDVIFYNRLDLNVAMPNNDVDGLYLFIPNDGPVDTYEVCDRLNKMFNYQIGPEDVVYAPVDSETLPVEVTITALPGSLAWTGSKFMTLVADRPMWGDTFASKILNGFEFPDADVSALTDPTTLKDQLSNLAVGQLLSFDWNLPANHVTVTTNSEIQLELAAREGDGTYSVTPDNDNAYTLQLGTEATWSLLVGAKLPAGQNIDALYATCLTITCPDNTTATFDIKRVGTTYRLVNEALGVNVPMSYNAADGSAFQSLVEITYLLDMMGEFTVAGANNAGSPIGVYSVRVQARRKNSIAPRVLTSILVKAYNNARAPDTSLVTEYQNAQELTFDWANLNGWTNTHLTVSGNKVYGNFTAPFTASYAVYPFAVAADEYAVLHGELYVTSATNATIYMGFCFGEDAFGADGIATGACLGGVGSTSNRPVSYLGANWGGGLTTSNTFLDDAAQADGLYRVTLTVTPEEISCVVRSADGTKEWVRVMPRSAAPNGGVITSIRIWNGSTTSGTNKYLKALGVRKSLTPFRTKSNAAGVIEGASERVVHRTVSDGWRIQFPKTMDGTQPTPVVMFFHQASSGNRNVPMTESRWTALRQAFSDRGYILASCDDQGDRWGSRASQRNHADLLRWLRKRVNVGKVFVLGYSMGGLAGLNAIANRTLGPVSAAAFICPVCDIPQMYDNAVFTPTIDASWGSTSKADLITKIKGFNPLTTSPAKFAKIPYVFNVANADLVVDPAMHTLLFEPLIRSVAKSSVVNTMGSGHGAPSTFDVTSIAGLFDANK